MDLLKSRSHLVEVDALVVRSCLYLLNIDELMECSIRVNVELLDMLTVFSHKSPDISYISAEV